LPTRLGSPEGGKLQAWMHGSVWLLGLLSDCYFDRVPPGLFAGQHVIPRGTNIVVPSMKINEVLDQDKLKERRRASALSKKAAVLPEKVSDAPHSIDANPKHREDFMRLVGAAARKREPKD